MKIYKRVAAALPFRPDDPVETQIQHLIYSSLDVVEERSEPFAIWATDTQNRLM